MALMTTRELTLDYRYQIDYGNGYEDVTPDAATEADEAGAAASLAEVEREGSARRADSDVRDEIADRTPAGRERSRRTRRGALRDADERHPADD